VTPIWLVLPDPFSSRLFFDTGIVSALRARVGDRLELVLDAGDQTALWSKRVAGIRIIKPEDLMSAQGPEKLLRRIDRSLDARIGFYPLSLRQSLRHGFNRERMRPGHQNWFLDSSRAGSLPDWRFLDHAMTSWHYRMAKAVTPAGRRPRVLRRWRSPGCASDRPARSGSSGTP